MATIPQTLTSKILKSADGTLIYADAVGDPSKPSVVFLHGGFLSSLVFDNLFNDQRWTDIVYMVRYDLRGHGRSGKPSDMASWESQRLSEDFDAVVEGFMLRRPFVAGWSMGGTHITDILTYHAPSYLSGIIHIASTPHVSVKLNTLTPLSRVLLPRLVRMSDITTFQSDATSFIAALTTEPEAIPYRLRQALLGDVMIYPTAVRVALSSRKQDPKKMLEAVQEGSLPVLMVFGTEDRIIDQEGVLRAVEDWKLVEVVNIHSGHMPWLESPDKFREKVLDWIHRSGKSELDNWTRAGFDNKIICNI